MHNWGDECDNTDIYSLSVSNANAQLGSGSGKLCGRNRPHHCSLLVASGKECGPLLIAMCPKLVCAIALQEKTQIYLPMTIMGCFGLIGGTALIILDDKSPRPDSGTDTNTNDEDTATNDDDNQDAEEENQDDNTNTDTNNDDSNTQNDEDNNADNNNDDEEQTNDQDQTDGPGRRGDGGKSRIPRLRKDMVNPGSTHTVV